MQINPRPDYHQFKRSWSLFCQRSMHCGETQSQLFARFMAEFCSFDWKKLPHRCSAVTVSSSSSSSSSFCGRFTIFQISKWAAASNRVKKSALTVAAGREPICKKWLLHRPVGIRLPKTVGKYSSSAQNSQTKYECFKKELQVDLWDGSAWLAACLCRCTFWVSKSGPQRRLATG